MSGLFCYITFTYLSIMELTITIVNRELDPDINGDIIQFKTLEGGKQETYTFARGSFVYDVQGTYLTVKRLDNSLVIDALSYLYITNGNAGAKFASGPALDSFLKAFEQGDDDEKYVSKAEFDAAIAELYAAIGNGTPLPQLATPDPTPPQP